MSELTSCNYCSLRNIKMRAKKENKKVEVKNAKDFGLGTQGKDVFVDGKKVAWFMKLSNTCEC